MVRSRSRRCCCTVVSTSILMRLAQHHSSDEVKRRALRSLAISQHLRGRRDIIGRLVHTTRGEVAVGTLRRTVYNAGGQETLPGVMVRTEGAPDSNDQAVNEAYNGAGAVYKLYNEVFGRNSIDNRGMPLDSTVHYGQGYDNAFWDGRQMCYGDGDGQVFGRFTSLIDVIGHEMTHGVTQYESSLDYYAQSGALNESISDIFGTMVKQYSQHQAFQDADWLIGAGLFTSSVRGVALRSMKAPGTAYDDPVLGKDRQPAHMRDYVNEMDDEGGVHTNSGIPNHWFYLLCQALASKPNAGDDDKFSWRSAGNIVYRTLPRLHHSSNFSDFATMTGLVAGQLFGAQSREQGAVKQAWAQVGINLP